MQRLIVVIACAALMGLASSVYAQGTEDWGGFYLGGQAGYGWGDREGCFGFDPTCTDGFYDYDLEGGLIGGKAGYNHMLNKILLGIEVDGAFSAISGEGDFGGFPGVGEYNYLATFGGRLGYSINRFLVYGTGGLAISGFDFEGSAGCEFDQTRDGYFAGGGAEFKLTERASIGVEYNYIDLGEEGQTCTSFAVIPTVTEAEAALDVFTFGFNYNFDGL